MTKMTFKFDVEVELHGRDAQTLALFAKTHAAQRVALATAMELTLHGHWQGLGWHPVFKVSPAKPRGGGK